MQCFRSILSRFILFRSVLLYLLLFSIFSFCLYFILFYAILSIYLFILFVTGFPRIHSGGQPAEWLIFIGSLGYRVRSSAHQGPVHMENMLVPTEGSGALSVTVGVTVDTCAHFLDPYRSELRSRTSWRETGHLSGSTKSIGLFPKSRILVGAGLPRSHMAQLHNVSAGTHAIRHRSIFHRDSAVVIL